MKMEVDVDAGFVARLARAGYELTGDFRVPRLGEYLVDPDSDSVIPAVNIVSGCRWIVRKAWEWPSDILGPNVWLARVGAFVLLIATMKNFAFRLSSERTATPRRPQTH